MTGESGKALLANRYRIVRQLGAGGMGSVWLAEDMQLDGKLFAIKMLPSILVSNKRAYSQLKSEALVSMRLVHPNIVQIRAFEENNGNPFLVMDYIDGETLDDWLGDRGQESGGRSQVSEEEVVRLLKPIAEALDYAHGEGVIHRDIKPANVMIRKDGRPFVMDFGIAREIQETMTRVTGKMSSGTLLYMSPEQLNGDMPKKEQDIYSFAAMVYECLKGEPPFCRGAIEDQIKNKEPEPLVGRVVLNAPSGGGLGTDRPTIADAVMRGLAKKPEDRPKSCAAVVERRDFNAETQSCRETQSSESDPLPDRKFESYQASQTDSADTPVRGCEDNEEHENAEVRNGDCKTENDEELKSVKKSAFGFFDLLIALLLVAVFLGAVLKWHVDRQNQIEQQEERRKIVAEQKRLAIEARDMASTAQAEAEKAGAKQLTSKEWNSALLEKSNAEGAWHRADYVNAKYHYLNVGDLFRKSIEVAQTRKKHDTESIKPELRVNAKLCGENVTGAKINDGVRDHITPIRWTLEYGKTYGPYKVTYEKNGRKYSGKLDAVKVDWLGAREKRVVLTEDVDFSLIEKTENTSKAIEAFNAKRYDEAYRLFMKSDLENKVVQYFLGRMYAYGQGVQKNEYEAVKWYRRAAEQGHTSAQNNLGIMYKGGRGVTKDDYEAVKWFRKSAEQGDCMGQCNLGQMYLDGRGVVQNDYEAVKWFRKASEHGHVIGHNRLAFMYASGRGVAKNEAEAFRLYRLSADKFPPSWYVIASMYENGSGVSRDVEEAKKWYRKAAEKGDENAKKALERLENVRVVKPIKYVQPVVNQPQQPMLIERPLNLKYCDNCGHALWHRKMIPPRCEKCNAILLKPEESKKNPTGIDQGTADSIRTWGSIMSGIGGVL